MKLLEPKLKAIQLIKDCLEIQLPNTNLSGQYEMAKIQAEYSANCAKWSHDIDTVSFLYWEMVKNEICNL